MTIENNCIQYYGTASFLRSHRKRDANHLSFLRQPFIQKNSYLLVDALRLPELINPLPDPIIHKYKQVSVLKLSTEQLQ